ncbi:MAG: FG-GAP-like repeat-containing protein [Planctomycetaceae bacterium]
MSGEIEKLKSTRWFGWRPFTLLIATIAVAFVAVLLWNGVVSRVPVETLNQQAREALAAGDYPAAALLCDQALRQDPSHVQTLLIAGDAAMRTERFEDALNFFGGVPESNSDSSITAQFASAEVLRALGRIEDAEVTLRKVIQRRPDHLMAHERLAFLLDLQGRRWESTPHLLEQLRQDRISFSTLIRLGTRDSLIPFPEELERIRQTNNARTAVTLAEAVSLLAEQQTEKAEVLLRDVIQQKPDWIEPQARLGRLLADQRISEIPAWRAQLPLAAADHPDIQTTLGLWCIHAGQNEAAFGCFARAATIDPDQRTALYQLGQLSSTEEFRKSPDLAAAGLRCAERARLLQKLAATMSQLSLNRSETTTMMTAADLLQQLGRYWEAYGWCGLVLLNDPTQEEARQQMQALARQLSVTLPQTASDAIPMIDLNLAQFPAPDWTVVSPSKQMLQTAASGTGIYFADRAEEAGLHFTYFHGRDRLEPGTKMFEFAGGGVGIPDFDLDGFADIYLTQGCRWPPETESTEHRDRLFRLDGSGRFMDVTTLAGLGDGWFSQGVAVGDMNSDGWPDLYIANIGRNRLYYNNGDGTYRDVTAEVGISGTQWTTSCLIADLNDDSCPDLYDVNYLAGEDLFERLCRVEGVLRACVPGVFPAERDRIYLSLQDESLEELSGQAAEALEPARPGLGIVAADTDGSGRLSLFVANDVTANAFLVNRTPDDGDELRLLDIGLNAGLAFDRDGRAQACMGVAADDVDGNGMIDIFVTNYFEEANSIYLQMAPGSFVESSRPTGLYQPGLHQLGFGTQFLDADLDGAVDLMVANGHLDDFSYMDIPYRMPPQLFRNPGLGQFQEISQHAGEYFTRKLLGRSVACVDWNNDGHPDLVITHIETPVALLTNETKEGGHWLKVRLWGTDSSRDAVGCFVTMRSGENTWTRQLTAGSGYQASNERVLIFGLGNQSSVDELSVRWPSGLVQTFTEVVADRHLSIVEGHSRLFEEPANR